MMIIPLDSCGLFWCWYDGRGRRLPRRAWLTRDCQRWMDIVQGGANFAGQTVRGAGNTRYGWLARNPVNPLWFLRTGL